MLLENKITKILLAVKINSCGFGYRNDLCYFGVLFIIFFSSTVVIIEGFTESKVASFFIQLVIDVNKFYVNSNLIIRPRFDLTRNIIFGATKDYIWVHLNYMPLSI